jgi:hypothetical protein
MAYRLDGTVTPEIETLGSIGILRVKFIYTCFFKNVGSALLARGPELERDG